MVTARLRLVPVGPGHVEDLVELHAHPDVAFWHNGAWSWGRARAFAESMAHRWRVEGAGKWMAYERGSGALVGRGGLSFAAVEGVRRLEVGWTVHPRMQRRGFAVEIGAAGLALAFGGLGAAEVVAFTEPQNTASRAVMRRLGMGGARPIVLRGAPFVLYTVAAPGA
ncbi:RimJ/RimL family protein N-acetyltransferase [Murinocardiopsis flavida]|uniref:RimJ/RimL family protein N-acetyltransferase n=1 Tax=Murinocardiopsis flavida TaxID=645275 RepID=A0A2P8DP34_9ACTN|nr:RimJ/RimL family protein N-acetyltransferase [Murinocardiopsis flavida]